MISIAPNYAQTMISLVGKPGTLSSEVNWTMQKFYLDKDYSFTIFLLFFSANYSATMHDSHRVH